MAAIQVDLRGAPLCVFTYPSEIGIIDFQNLFRDFLAQTEEGKGYGLLVDLRAFDPIVAGKVMRDAASSITQASKELHSSRVVCAARVAPDPVIRAFLTVYDAQTPTDWTTRNFSGGEAAESWARAQLASKGIACPAEQVWQEERG